jgi:hypothetical protein
MINIYVKKASFEYIKNFRNSSKCNKVLTSNDDMFHVIKDFYTKYYPNGDIFSSTKLIKILKNEKILGYKFEFTLEDNTKFSPSLNKCVKNINHNTLVKKAFRNCIIKQINDYKKQEFFNKPYIMCQLTNKLVDWEQSSVDHIAPLTFRQLIVNFLDLMNLKFENIELISEQIGGHSLKDQELTKIWVQYHLENAKLRVISNEEHKKINLNMQ